MVVVLLVALAAGVLAYGGRWVALLRGLGPVVLALFLGFGAWGAVAAAAATLAAACISPIQRRHVSSVAFGSMFGLSPLATFWAILAGTLALFATHRRGVALTLAVALAPALMVAFRAPDPYTLFAASSGIFVGYQHWRHWPRRADIRRTPVEQQ